MMDGIILYAIGCLTGLLIGLILLIMQVHIMKYEKTATTAPAEEIADTPEDDKLSKQFDNFLSYTGKIQNED